jgi:hypothetical protein
VNTATTAAATAEAMAAQSVAFSDKASCQSMSKLAMTDNWSTEETDDPLYADRRNSYKVEKLEQGRTADRGNAPRWQQPRQGAAHL